MGLFDALKKLGGAAVDTALLPVDVVRDLNPLSDDTGVFDGTARRLRKIDRELEEAYEETFEDD